MTLRAAGNNNDPTAVVAPTGLESQITDDTKLFTLSKGNYKKLSEQLKSGFRRTLKWNKYRSQMTAQSNNNNLNYLIEPTLTKFNRLFALSFEKIEENNVKKDHRGSFSRYYVPNVEVEDFDRLIDGKSFFDLPVKNEEETYEKIIGIS